MNRIAMGVLGVSVEAAMTGAFVLGPLAGVAGALVGIWRARAARPPGGGG